MNYMQLGRTDGFPRPVGDRLQLDLGAGDLSEQLVRRRPLPERPELAQQRPRLAAREPRVAELLAQEVPQLRLERPRAQVRGDVEAGVDVDQVVRVRDR